MLNQADAGGVVMEGYEALAREAESAPTLQQRLEWAENEVERLTALNHDRREREKRDAEQLRGAVSRIEALRRAVDRALGSSSLSLPTRDALTQALIDDDRAGGR